MADAILVALLVSFAAPPPDASTSEPPPVEAEPSAADVKKAKAAEARAFQAIEGERWCDAMQLFLKANAAAPSVDLVYNAAQAADLAKDREQALKLYQELVGAYPESERQAQVDERIRELGEVTGSEGAGSPCPTPPATTTTTAEAPVTPPEPAPEVSPLEDERGHAPPPDVLPWTIAGAGGLLVAGGAVLTTLGALPFFSFLDAREKILAAEKAGADAGALQEQQADARAGWESWGELTAWTGLVTVVSGALVTTAGLVWALSSGDEALEEEAPSERDGAAP